MTSAPKPPKLNETAFMKNARTLQIAGGVAALVGLVSVMLYSVITAPPQEHPPAKPGQTEQHSSPPGKAVDEPTMQIIKALTGLNKGKMARFQLLPKPLKLPTISLIDEQQNTYSLTHWRGKFVLLNIWATWCAPCREEMPTLDRLKSLFQNSPFDVVTVSIDHGGLAKPRQFFTDIKVKHLTLYGDAMSGRLAPKLRAFGMPTTILISPSGYEIGRFVGPAEWASDDALALIRKALAAGQASTKP